MKVNFGKNKLSIGHKDYMGNLNELVKIGNSYRKAKGLSNMRVDKILALKGITEYILMLANKPFNNIPKLGYVSINTLQDAKKQKSVIRTKTKNNAGTWAHLNIMIRVAIEMSAEFADEVIETFINGKLLEYRDVSGNEFKTLSKSIDIFEPTTSQRIKMAKALNYIVFDYHYAGLRDKATKEQLTKLNELQKKLAFAVDMGYIKSFDELVNEMRRIYKLANS